MTNNKILVEISVPASQEKYDVYLPLDIRTSDAVKLVSSALSEMANNKYKAKEDSILCDAETGIIFNINTEVAELNLKNGSRLLLI